MDANLETPNSTSTTNSITKTTSSNDIVSHKTDNDDDNDYYYDDSNYSTPYASAPSSPLNPTTSFFFHSAPTSPMHYAISTDDGTSRSAIAPATSDASSSAASFEFEFSYRFDSSNSPEIGESMSTADELFLNGQIRPMKLSAHLSTNQDDEIRIPRDLRLRSKSRRRTRSMSPLRNTTPFDWLTESTPEKMSEIEIDGEKIEENVTKNGEQSSSSSSSRCSSAGRSSKRWLFLKDFLRSKSEGRSNSKFWQNISFSPAKEKEKKTNGDSAVAETAVEAKRSGGGGGRKDGPVKKAAAAAKRRSAHEMHYAAKRAEAEEMRKKTYLPYRQGLFGCIGFHPSNGYGGGVLHGFARVLNPVSSR